MKGKLALRALIKFTVGLVFVGAMLFIPAGTLRYYDAWLFIALLFIPMAVLGTVLLIKSPALLEKRLSAKEKEGAQRGVVALSGVMFLASFILAGLDCRFSWSHVPIWLTVTSSLILLVSYALYAEVMRENAYLSRTVEVQAEQKVVDTGLYGIVRHPMYAVTLWLFLAIPIVLGSYIALVPMLPYPLLLILRIRNEEKLLTEKLSGYAEYQKKVKYRLIPFLW